MREVLAEAERSPIDTTIATGIFEAQAAAEAKDLNEAIRLAEKIPPARYGSVEIRPARELQISENAR